MRRPEGVDESPDPSAKPPVGSKEISTDEGLKFLAGAVLPFIIALLLARANSLNSSYYFDNDRYDQKITVSSADNSTFELMLDIPEEFPTIIELRVGSATNYLYLAGGEHMVHIGEPGLYENDWSSRLMVTQLNGSDNYSSSVIGYYEPSNQTIYFQLENASHEYVTFHIQYNWNGTFGSKLHWWVGRLIPLTAGVAGIGGIAIAAKYNNTMFGKGIGAGLLAAGGVVLLLIIVGSLLGNFAACVTAC